MPDYTTKLNLAKPNTTTEPNNTFNLDTYLNDNWEKIDTFATDTITTDKLINNLASTEPGFGLDSRQGTAIGNRLTTAEGNIATNTAQLLKVPFKTTADITYYVSTTGNDTNDGLTSGTAFRTIQHAIDILPQVINHTATIYTASGTYNENVSIVGFSGKGIISLIGDTIVSSTRIVNSFSIKNNPCPISIQGFKAITTSAVAVLIDTCARVSISYFNIIDTTTSYDGINYNVSLGYVLNSTISNRRYAINAPACSTVFSSTNSGTGNVVGLYSANASTIGKYSTQPAGTTAETSVGGGVIR